MFVFTMVFVRIILAAIILQLSQSASSPSPFFTFQPPLIEAGIIYFQPQGSIDAYKSTPSTTGTSYWQNNFVITFKRLRNNNKFLYWIVYGIRSFDGMFHGDNSVAYHFHIWPTASSTTNYETTVVVGNDYYFQVWKIGYLFGQNRVSWIYFQERMLNINRLITPATPYTQIVTFPYITQAAITKATFYSLKISYNALSVTRIQLKANVLATATVTDFQILVQGVDVFAEKVGLHIMIAYPAVFNDESRQTIIYREELSVVNSGNILVMQGGGIPHEKRNDGFLFMLHNFDSNALKANFEFSIGVDNQIWLSKTSSMSEIGGNLLVIYGKSCMNPYYFDQASQQCKKCLPNCIECALEFECYTCATNFTLDSTWTQCTCPYPVVSGLCYDFDNSPMKYCISALMDPTNSNINCIMCDTKRFLAVVNNQCQCRNGYRLNPVTQLCQQICGDGILTNMQCDDGNLIENDGCSPTCKKQLNFICDTSVQPSNCISKININFKIDLIFKNQNNTGILKISPQGFNFPFQLKPQQFSSISFTLKIIKDIHTMQYISLHPNMLAFQNNQITFLIDYQFTIQDHYAQILVDMSKSKYPTYNPNLKFTIKGDNRPLVYTNNLQIFKKTQIGLVIASVFLLIILFAVSLASKYIGLESIVTLQLIFYSQLLITPFSKLPTGFLMLDALKYSNGYNQLFHITKYEFVTQMQYKFQNLGLHKLLVENFNTSFLLMFVVFVVFLVTMIARSMIEKSLIVAQNEHFDVNDLKEKQIKFRKWQKINEYAFHCSNQISLWCIFILFSGVSAQLEIKNSHTKIISSNFLLILIEHLNEVVIFISSGIIFVMGLSYFGNVVLSSLSIGKMRQRPMQLNYKRIFFIYLNLMAMMILFGSQIKIMSIPMSVIALIVHLVYVALIVYIYPYKMSLTIHSIGLFTCLVLYGLFLLFINVINFVDKVDEISVLIMGYFVLGGCALIIVLAIVRLYYEYRYGEALEIQIQKQRENDQKKKLQKEEELMKKYMKNLEEQAHQRLTSKQYQRMKNPFLIDSQLIHEDKVDLLHWLENRGTMTKEQKEEYFYKKFESKPIEWIKQSNEYEYQHYLQNEEQRKEKEKSKQIKKSTDPEYVQVMNKLKKSYAKKFMNSL